MRATAGRLANVMPRERSGAETVVAAGTAFVSGLGAL
jgi:hypothetical protein